PPFAWPNYVLGSHDAPRLVSRIGEAQARVAAMLLLTLRGTPTLYYGDQIGMVNGDISQEKIQDPQGRRFGPERNRDVSRTPMQWDNTTYAGFSAKGPWLPVSPDFTIRNVTVQNDDSESLLNLYRRLIWYRRSSRVLQGGSFRVVDSGEETCFAYFREHPTGRILIALNFSERSCTLSFSEKCRSDVVLSTYLDREESVSLSELFLRPNEGIIVEISS
ncbi:MAG: alpha-glucosidase C-terminal domain-containing protein, partial [Anaerolineales bacterium]|nr:alpha-glucosidase C-terminal domain-containing protein [Anaerolineales bacterium]